MVTTARFGAWPQALFTLIARTRPDRRSPRAGYRSPMDPAFWLDAAELGAADR